MLRLGWKAGPEQFPPTELMQYAVAADQAGFDLLDVSDHFNPWSEEGQACFTWTWLGAVAVQTKRIALGTGVTCPILRYHPSIIAQATATVSCFAPQRTYLGVGTGEALNEYASTGKWPGYSERQARLAEAIDLIRTLWSGEEVTYEGQYYQTRKSKLFTPPAAKIPLYISSMVGESATFAGKYGDGLISVAGKQPDVYKQIMSNFDKAAREAGKDPSNMPKLIEMNVEYSQDIESDIQSQIKYWAGSYVPALFDQKIYTPKMSQENGAVVGPDSLKKLACISSKAEDHVKFIQQYIDLGFNTLIFHSAATNQRSFIESYARDVLPHVREKNS